jgi:hypothetical protein
MKKKTNPRPTEAMNPVSEITTFITCPQCKSNNGQDDHTCPYSEEINCDSETMCNCCVDCEHECAMSI